MGIQDVRMFRLWVALVASAVLVVVFVFIAGGVGDVVAAVSVAAGVAASGVI